MEGYSMTRASSFEALLEFPDHTTFDALVIYLHHKRISSRALTAFDRFVQNGGGVLAVHSATASFKPTRHYFEILGGRFIGHGPVREIAITAVPSSDGLFTGLPDFRVRDELYLHELQPGIEIRFCAVQDGQTIPVVWTHHYGRGRVCYAGPGHRSSTMNNQTYREVLRRGLAWVSR